MNVFWNRLGSRLCVLAGAAILAAPVSAQGMGGVTICGGLENAYGPYDYRTDTDKLGIVERFHFNADVESLRAGMTSHKIGGDISYTLRAFPNHHRALHAIARLGLKEKATRPRGSKYTIDCWFDRAMRFRPDDPMVRLTYGIYLSGVGKKQEALKMLETAEKLGETGANFHYNMGLLYADLGRYEQALEHAHQAYALGFNLPGLRSKLERAGKWRDAAPSRAKVKAAPETGVAAE